MLRQDINNFLTMPLHYDFTVIVTCHRIDFILPTIHNGYLVLLALNKSDNNVNHTKNSYYLNRQFSTLESEIC